MVSDRLLSGPSTWYSFAFPSDAGVCGTHYQIVLTANGNPIQMEVFQNCGGTNVTCGVAESTTGYTSWQWTNSGLDCTQTYPTTFDVEVFATGSGSTCMDFTLTAYFE